MTTSDLFFKARMKGGYKIHVKAAGAAAAICGAEPREVRPYSQGRQMRRRAGWMVYRHATAALLDKVSCPECIAAAPLAGAEYLVE